MFVKKFKCKCSVRGCKNTENVFVLSKRREMGNTIAMCRDCMKEALRDTESYTEPPKVKPAVKPLFPHPEHKSKFDVTLSSVADPEPEPKEVIETETEDIPIESAAEDTVTTNLSDIAKESKPAHQNHITKVKNTSKKKK